MSPNGSDDLDFMARALELAARPVNPSPNPRVGAVLVRDGEIVGEGEHEGAGSAHAEAIALDKIADATGTTLYVTLEPCAHAGKTPPCAPAIVESSVRRVVVAMQDPDERVRGRGIEILKNAGIDVEVGVLEAEAARLNAPYVMHRTHGRSFVTLKLALSIDGRLAAADGSARWITGPGTRRSVHVSRAAVDAVMLGVGSIIADDPELTARDVEVDRPPLKVIVDSSGRTPVDARLFATGEVVIATTRRCPFERQTALKEAGADVWVLAESSEGVDLPELLTELARRDVLHVFCEGGAELATSLLKAQLADRLEIHTGALVLGGGPSIQDLGVANIDGALRWNLVSSAASGDDVISVYEPERE
jgi:diaminohydroxyphosphoribosylaminopyrimidine deaminase / 5-amino-6-(5-phosphoribosylamino)uracil reductase